VGADDATRETLLKPGQLLVDKYRVMRLIGRGGMAEVYAAHHELLHQTVAIKILLPEVAHSSEASTRFLNEARAAARIRGENIAAVMDVGTLPGGAAYMVLEYLDGRDLEAYAEERGPLPMTEVVDYVLEALQALAQAHAIGIVHRDIKPSNLFLAKHPDGSSVVKVLDFGISKSSQALGLLDGNSTSTRAMMGSPYYMAPEQARSAKAVDQRADVWAVGVVLYRLLAGRVPFLGETLAELILVIAQDDPRPLRDLRPDLPVGLQEVIARCLFKQPAQRFANVAELAAALQPYGGPDAARIVGRIARTLSLKPPTNDRATPPPAQSPIVVTSGGVQPGTGAAWAESNPGQPIPPPGAKGRLLIAGAIALGAVALIGVAAVSLTGKHPSSASTAEPAASAPESPHPNVTPRANLAMPNAPAVVGQAATVAPSSVTSSPSQAVPSPSSPSAVVGGAPPGHETGHPTTPHKLPPGKAAPSAAAPAYDVLNQRN
jgi:serine/threonine-protein kinase